MDTSAAASSTSMLEQASKTRNDLGQGKGVPSHRRDTPSVLAP
jgi:hypothetical protein